MKNLKLLQVNLQQTLVYEEKNNFNAVHAIHDKHKNLVVVRVEYDTMAGQIKDQLETSGLVCENVIFGDGFGCDTWDDKIKFFHK